jgi:putative flippase GtrA
MKPLIEVLKRDLLSVKFLKFLTNAILTYPLMIGLTYVLTEYAGLYYLLAYVLSLSLAILFTFFLSMKWIFKVRGKVFSRLIRYLVVLVLFSILNTLLVKILTEHVHVYYLVSITVVSGGIFILKYMTYKRKVFDW